MTLEIWTQGRDCEALARIHAASFDESWDTASFARLLEQAGVFAAVDADGFILIRVASDESEVITLAVEPASRRRGLGRALVCAGAAHATAMGAEKLFLEVNVGNFAAINLYNRLGFLEVGIRPGYYQKESGVKEDALVLSADLPLLGEEKISQPRTGCIRRDRS